jgi:hypothetical protein
MTGRFVIQHIDGNDWPFAGGGDQGGLIGQAKILAEPEQDGM